MKHKRSKIYISDTLLERSGELLASFSDPEPAEGIVYWFGFELAGKSVITSILVPNANTNYGCVSTTAEANAQVLMSVVGTPLVLIGQAHSHPGSIVRHSDVDDRQTFPRFEGAISVVAPYFARRGMDLNHCGVHRFIEGEYRLLKPGKVRDHLVVVPGERDFRQGQDLAEIS